MRFAASVLLALVFGLFGVVPTGAQVREVAQGSVLRMHLEQGEIWTGRLDQASLDSIWFTGQTGPSVLPLSALRRLEVRERMSRGAHGWRWAKRGFAVGAVLGAAACLADVANCEAAGAERDGLAEGLLGASLFYGTGVGVIGWVAGALIPGREWVELPL